MSEPMTNLIIAIVIICLIPFFLRWTFALIGIACVFVIVSAVRADAQQTRTTCYDSGNTRICETFDSYGAILSKSPCYRSGKDLRCDTQNFQPVPRQ
jgi:hypothetical protein